MGRSRIDQIQKNFWEQSNAKNTDFLKRKGWR